MTEIWNNLTMPQAVVIAAFLYGLFIPTRTFEIPSAWWSGITINVRQKKDQ
jgi:hypothetical protein